RRPDSPERDADLVCRSARGRRDRRRPRRRDDRRPHREGPGVIAYLEGPGVIAYLDCVGGLAGDMLLAALLDAGAPEQALRGVPNRLGLEPVELRLERVQRHGIGALRVDVMSDPDHHPHRSWRSIREQLLAADL